MRQCSMDCIHGEACGRYAGSSTFVRQEDCPAYKSSSDFFEVQYLAAFLENVEFAHDCGIPVAPKDDDLYELLIKAMPKLKKECVKRFAKFLINRAEGAAILVSDLPDLVMEFREEFGK